MFRKTDTTPQLDLFTAPSNILPKRAQEKYTDEKAWHNQFFKLVTSQIDEESFRPLFEETEGIWLCDQHHRNGGRGQAEHHHLRTDRTRHLCGLPFP